MKTKLITLMFCLTTVSCTDKEKEMEKQPEKERLERKEANEKFLKEHQENKEVFSQ